MRVGVHLVHHAAPGGVAATAGWLADLGSACDETGVDVLSCLDHHLQPGYLGPVTDPVLEGYTTLGFLAAHTTGPDLQLLVTGVTLRPPGLLAKTVATLDVLSGGRAALGLGAGWYEREHRALGLPFPPLRDRFVLLEETLRVVRQMWSEDDGPFLGEHYRLAETICRPQPLHRVPVLLAGVGERTALRLVAEHADACSIFAGGEQGADWVRGRLEVLRAHCEAAGTSYDGLRRTILWTPPVDPRSPRGFLDQMRAMVEVGVDEVHLTVAEPDAAAHVRALGEQVLPTLAAL